MRQSLLSVPLLDDNTALFLMPASLLNRFPWSSIRLVPCLSLQLWAGVVLSAPTTCTNTLDIFLHYPSHPATPPVLDVLPPKKYSHSPFHLAIITLVPYPLSRTCCVPAFASYTSYTRLDQSVIFTPKGPI
ncbi:hypothetical protein BDQ17DRAFT_692572 [Cyathus striatus]|nr:hypothetical protein BDQ17DRAFT_692572 [Cyathus striatus]